MKDRASLPTPFLSCFVMTLSELFSCATSSFKAAMTSLRNSPLFNFKYFSMAEMSAPRTCCPSACDEEGAFGDDWKVKEQKRYHCGCCMNSHTAHENRIHFDHTDGDNDDNFDDNK